MADKLDEIVEAVKRMKQLENQNLKLKQLLRSAEDMSGQDANGISRLREEAENLYKTVGTLEKEKEKLQEQLDAVLSKENGEMFTTLSKLEAEHMALQSQLNTVLSDINKENSEIECLKEEDAALKQALVELEEEKIKLEDKMKVLEEQKSVLSRESFVIRERLSQLESPENEENQTNQKKQENQEHQEHPRASLTKTLATHSLKDFNSEENVLSNFKNLEKTYKEYIEVLEEHTLQQKISILETRNEELVNIIQETSSKDIKSQIKLNEAIIQSNTDILHKIKDAKSKLATSIEANSTLIETLEESKEMESKISELEKEKDLLYDDLEKSLEFSAQEITKLKDELEDPEIRRLVNEIEIQKTLLLYNLKMLKMKDDPNVEMPDTLKLPSVPCTNIDSKDMLPLSSDSSQIHAAAASTNIYTTPQSEKSADLEPSTSKEPSRNEHGKLEEQITRLENERKELLRKLHSISETSAQRFEERQLQTQSELHNTFMREQSSQEIVVGKNFDDATNQLYADEDARLEQRIRELELENARIKKELEILMKQIRSEQDGAFQYTTRTLKERIDELEHKNKDC